MGSGDVGAALEARQPDRHVDVNNQQADGPSRDVLSSESVDGKFRAFGWHTQRVDGNDIAALVAVDAARTYDGTAPRAIICDTLMGKGVESLSSGRRTTSSVSMRTSG